MIKNIIFWQNIISPHQSALIRSLSEIPGLSVTLVVEQEIDSRRKKMGWLKPDLGNTNLIVSPSKEQISALIGIDSKNTAHIFSGTRAYPMVWFAFKLALKKKCFAGFVAEPGNWFGIKGKLRLLRSKYDALLVNNKIKFILANGHKAVEWYSKSGYSKHKIFDFGYFIDPPDLPPPASSHSVFKLIFVGRFSPEKGLDLLLEAVSKISLKYELLLVGEGNEQEKLQQKVADLKLEGKVSFKGFMPNIEVLRHIQQSDLLVLPSTGKDGWGTVVNEALMVGTPVVCSDNCGASVLLTDIQRGEVFNPSDINNFVSILTARIGQGPLNSSTRDTLMKWTKRIEGKSAAEYLVNVLRFSAGTNTERPEAPWIKN